MKEIHEAFERADAVVVLAGAGMGVDAGIPDFRGVSGVWTSEKDTFIKFASGSAWDERPLEAWNFYVGRFLNYSNTPPHRGYYALRELLERLNLPYFVVTSNVDRHFAKSGWDTQKIYEIHGSLEYTQCRVMCTRNSHPMPPFTRLLESDSEMPLCPDCGDILRPQVLMFNDPYFLWTKTEEQSRRYLEWEANYQYKLGIELGAGTYVPSIRNFSHERTEQTIRINPHQPGINRRQDISMPSTAVDGIDLIIKILGDTHEPRTI